MSSESCVLSSELLLACVAVSPSLRPKNLSKPIRCGESVCCCMCCRYNLKNTIRDEKVSVGSSSVTGDKPGRLLCTSYQHSVL